MEQEEAQLIEIEEAAINAARLEATQPQVMEESKSDKKQMNCKLFGIVVQRDLPPAMVEEDKKEERKKHFLSKEIIFEMFKQIYNGYKIEEYVIAHEHGEKNDDCHFQCCVQLDKPLRSRITEFKKTVNGVDLYILYQMGKKGLKALALYCKEDGDYICSPNVEKMVKTKRPIMERLLECKNHKEQLTIMVKEMPQDVVKGDLSRMFKNIETAKQVMVDTGVHMTFPEYLMDREPMLFEWYMKEMAGYPVDYKGRRKALVLFSKERAMGKTTFAKMLVKNNDDGYIICRNNFNALDFNKPNAQLLILDDLMFINKQVEMWKALVSSEKTAIRDAYCNVDFAHGMATIITTNNYAMFTYMMGLDIFKYECYFHWVKEYLGPEGTNPRGGKRRMKTNFTMEELERQYGPPKKLIQLESGEEDNNNN